MCVQACACNTRKQLRKGSWLVQCITSLKNEDTSICFQEPQLLTGVSNWVTTLRKPKEEGRDLMEGDTDIFRIETSKEEPAQDTLS